MSSSCGWRRWPPDTAVDVNIKKQEVMASRKRVVLQLKFNIMKKRMLRI
jgi:hypothetical protein